MNSRASVFRVVWGPQRFYLSLGWKTLIAFALVVFLPMAGLLMLTGQTMRDVLENETGHALEANIRVAWSAYQRPLEDVRIALVQAADSDRTARDLAQRDATALFRLLERQAKRFDYVDLWFAVDREQAVQGRIQGPLGDHYNFGSGFGRALGTLRENLITTELLPRDLFVSENPQHYATLPPLVLAQLIIAPVRDQGALVGVMLLNGNELLLQRIQNRLTIENTHAALIQGNRVIATAGLPDEPHPVGSQIETALDRAIESGSVYSGQLGSGDQGRLVLAEPILNGDFQPVGGLMLTVDNGKIAAHVAQNSRHIYLFIGLGILLSLGVAYLAYRDTVRPLRAIVAAQDAFAEGDHGVRTEIVTRDEFESLGAGFNRMADAVAEHDRRLTQYTALSSLVNLSLSAEELLQGTLEKVIDISRGLLGVIYLRDEGSNRLVPYACHGLDLEAMDSLKVGEGIPGQAALERESRLVDLDGADLKNVVLHLGVGESRPRQLAYFPLIYRGDLLGLLLLGFAETKPESEHVLLEHLSRQVSIILSDAASQRRIRDLATHDPLTHVANRGHFSEQLEQQFNSAQRYGTDLALLLIDIDHFRKFTDRYGYHMADLVLTAVAGVLKKSVRKTDLVARFGENKFAAILPHTDLEQAMVTAEKIRKNLIGTAVTQLERERVTISIGTAAYPDPSIQSPVEMVRRADQALLKAKQAGRNRVEAAA
ncbi:MAG: diguanylate cyclase [Gammaproteobacteria bacterium]|nr:diguanylate cyclase [Gammaproteobacteria bacterium]